MRIYVAGPLARPIPSLNVHRATRVGTQLYLRGHLPFVPHLFYFWKLLTSSGASQREKDFLNDEKNWAALALSYLPSMDAMFVIDGDTYYGEVEKKFAMDHQIPIYCAIDDVPYIMTAQSAYDGNIELTNDLPGWVAILEGLTHNATAQGDGNAPH